jgi:hypothetical protein
MIQEGHVRVVWINSNDTIASPRYTVTFACYEPPEEFSTQKSKAIVGEAELLRFLQLINVDADDLKTGSRVLEERGYVEFANVVLSDERLANFAFKVENGGGVERTETNSVVAASHATGYSIAMCVSVRPTPSTD